MTYQGNEPDFGSEQDNARMFEILCCASIGQAVRCAAKFSFAEHLLDGSRTADDIARAELLEPSATFRLMRACVAFGLLAREGEAFAATPLLRTLHRDNPAGMAATALSQLAPGFWLPYGRLDAAVATGRPQAEAVLGSSLWSYYAGYEAKEEAQAFVGSMEGLSRSLAEQVTRLIPMAPDELIFDLGGGAGTLVFPLLRANPRVRGGVLDLSHAAKAAREQAVGLGLEARFQAVEGDILQGVPEADVYMLKNVLHNWRDHDCRTILRNCRKAMSAGGRLFLFETLMDDVHPSVTASAFDLGMLVMFGARERTADEFGTLLATCGYAIDGVKETGTPFSMIEAVAV